jgi:hypothetical protein
MRQRISTSLAILVGLLVLVLAMLFALLQSGCTPIA